MADLRKAGLPLLLALLAGGVWYLWTNQGSGHNLQWDMPAFSDLSYDPYAHWRIQRDGGFIRHYPERVGPNCLPQALAEEAGALSTRGVTPSG